MYREIVLSGVHSNGGPKEQALSAAMATAIGQDVSVALVANGTLALQLACQACLLPARPYVLLPSFTFAAGGLVLRALGYQPVFVDVEHPTWQPSIDGARAFVEDHADQIAGILLTQTFGIGIENIDEWEHFAADEGLPLGA